MKIKHDKPQIEAILRSHEKHIMRMRTEKKLKSQWGSPNIYIRTFAEKCCVNRRDVVVPKYKLLAAFNQWCGWNDYPPMHIVEFGLRLMNTFPDVVALRSKKLSGKMQGLYVGIDVWAPWLFSDPDKTLAPEDSYL